MKKILAAVFLVTFGAQLAAAQWGEPPERAPDVGFALQLDVPGRGNFDLYDYGITGKLQFRGWFTDAVGYGVSIGYGEWSTDRNATRPGARLFDYSGNLQIVPVSASVRYVVWLDDVWDLVFDLGLTYMITDSSITARNLDQGGAQRYKVSVGDAFQLTPAIGTDYHMADNMIWSFAVGYRHDLSRGSIRTELGPARDNIMESFFAETAIRFLF